MLRRKNSSMVTILIINTLLKESSNRAIDGLPQTQARPPEEERPWYYSPVMCEHWLQAQRLNPLEGHIPLLLGWLTRAENTSAMDRKPNRRCERPDILLQSHWVLSAVVCCPWTDQGLEQLSDQIKDEAWTGLVRWKGSWLWAGWRDPSHVRNTLVLLQGDGLSRYIRVQAVQLGGRSLRATTPSDRAWGTRRRTSFGPVLESGVTLLVVMEFLSTGVCDTPSHLPL